MYWKDKLSHSIVFRWGVSLAPLWLIRVHTGNNFTSNIKARPHFAVALKNVIALSQRNKSVVSTHENEWIVLANIIIMITYGKKLNASRSYVKPFSPTNLAYLACIQTKVPGNSSLRVHGREKNTPSARVYQVELWGTPRKTVWSHTSFSASSAAPVQCWKEKTLYHFWTYWNGRFQLWS